MMMDLAWPAATVASWFVMYFVFIRPMLAKIHATVGPSAPLAHSKTVITSVLVSVFAMGKSALDVLSQNTGGLDEAKNLPWATFLTPDMALKAVGVIMFLVTGLHLWGVLAAARATPKA